MIENPGEMMNIPAPFPSGAHDVFAARRIALFNPPPQRKYSARAPYAYGASEPWPAAPTRQIATQGSLPTSTAVAHRNGAA